MPGSWSGGLSDILPNLIVGQMVQRGMPDFLKKKMRGVITQVWGGNWVDPFQPVKMNHGTNGQRCTLFRGVCRTFKKKIYIYCRE